MRLLAVYATLLASTLVLTNAEQAKAQDSAVDRARALGQKAGTEFEQGHWEEARSLYHQARDLYPAPTLGVREARCLVKLGRLVEAKLIYERVEALPVDAANADPATFKRAQAEAKQELTAVEQRLPYLTVRAEGGARVALTLDGVAIPNATIGMERQIDPGLHSVAGTIDDKPIEPIAVTLADSDHRSVVAKLATATTALATTSQPSPEEAPPSDVPRDAAPSGRGTVQRALGISAMGLGLVGVAVGVGLGVEAGSKHSDLNGACNNGVCPPDQQSTLDSFHALTTGSTVAYVLGGVFAAGGLVLVLTAPRNKPAPATGRLEPLLGLGAIGMRGTF